VQPTLSADAITLENSSQLRLASHLGRGRLLDALWSPDEKYLAVNTTQCLILYEAASLQPLRSLLDATALAFDGRDRLLIGGESPLQLIDGVTGEVERTFGSPGVLAADFSHDGRQLAVAGHVVAAGRDDGLAIIDVQDGGMRVLESGRGIFGIAQRVEFTSDGRRLVASFPGALRLWDVGSGKEIRPPITGNTGPAVISPDGQLIAYFTNRFVIDNLEVEKGGLYRTINADGTPFFATTITHPRLEPIDYTFTLDGRLLVSYRKIDKMTNTTTATLIAWDLANGTARTQVDDLITLSTLTGEFADEYLEDRDRHVPAFRLGPLGHLLCSLTQDGVIRLWAYPSAAPKASSPTDWVDQMAVSPDGRLVALPDAQGAIQLIDLGTGSVVRSFRGSWRPAQMTFASLSVLVLLQPDRRALFLDTQSGALLETQELSSVQDTRYFAWRPDGWLFAAWARSFVSDRLSVFALAPGPPLLDLGRFPRPDAVAFSPDGERLAVLRGKAVEVWNVHSQRLDLKLAGQGKAVGRLAFSPDGTRLAAATGEVWSLSDGKQMASFGGGADQVVWSPDGSLIVGSDGNLWAAASGTSAGKLEGLRGPAVHMAFTADGRWLVWQVPGGVIEVWGLTSPGE
jgi:WD40 repeat protein